MREWGAGAWASPAALRRGSVRAIQRGVGSRLSMVRLVRSRVGPGDRVSPDLFFNDRTRLLVNYELAKGLVALQIFSAVTGMRGPNCSSAC
jgi:hypothetical protein